MSLFCPTDESNIGSDSDIDPQEEDIAEASSSRTERVSALTQRSEEIPWSKSAISKSDERAAKERTVSRTSDDTCCVDADSSERHMSKIKDGVLPGMQSSSFLSAGHRQALDFSSVRSQQFLKLGAPLLVHPGQLSVKPEAFSTAGMEHVFSSLPRVNNHENGGLPSQSITSPSPFMFHLSQHMLASQVHISKTTIF